MNAVAPDSTRKLFVVGACWSVLTDTDSLSCKWWLQQILNTSIHLEKCYDTFDDGDSFDSNYCGKVVAGKQ